MKTTIKKLHAYSRILAHIFEGNTPSNMISNDSNFRTSIFKNYNKDGVGFPKDVKKPFGFQSILESFAKSLSYTTFNGLIQSGQQEFNLTETALIPMNPFPMNRFYSDLWRVVTTGLMRDLLNDSNCTEEIFLGFKRDKLNSQYLVGVYSLLPLVVARYTVNVYAGVLYTDQLVDLRFSNSIADCSHYYGVAHSMLSHALNFEVRTSTFLRVKGKKQDCAPNVNPCEEKEYVEVIEGLKLKDFVTFNQWRGVDFPEFKKNLIEIMKNTFKVKLEIKGKEPNPLEREVVMTFKSKKYRHNVFSEQKELCEDMLGKYEEILLNHQKALMLISPEIREDKSYYQLSPEHKYILPNAYEISDKSNLSLKGQVFRLRKVNEVKLAEFLKHFGDGERYSKIGEQPHKGKKLYGTKLYLLNLIQLRFIDRDSSDKNKIPTVDEILAYWRNQIINSLIPYKGRAKSKGSSTSNKA